ncbi:hypothetical protein [Mycolicibacterium bacteremicum]|nr:hypothetical protein [Mycolicibacterium bacteremicum]
MAAIVSKTDVTIGTSTQLRMASGRVELFFAGVGITVFLSVDRMQ